MIPRSIDELDHLRKECKAMVNKRATASAAAAAIPVPMIDIGVDVAIMMELLPAINRKFGLTPEQIDQLDPALKKKLLVFVTSIGNELIGKHITKKLVMSLLKKAGAKISAKQAAKIVPIVGQAVSAGISFAAMKYLGNSLVEECYNLCKQLIELHQGAE